MFCEKGHSSDEAEDTDKANKKLSCRREAAQCFMSVGRVSFNITIGLPQAQSFIVCYFGFRFTNAYN